MYCIFIYLYHCGSCVLCIYVQSVITISSFTFRVVAVAVARTTSPKYQTPPPAVVLNDAVVAVAATLRRMRRMRMARMVRVLRVFLMAGTMLVVMWQMLLIWRVGRCPVAGVGATSVVVPQDVAAAVATVSVSRRVLVCVVRLWFFSSNDG